MATFVHAYCTKMPFVCVMGLYNVMSNAQSQVLKDSLVALLRCISCSWILESCHSIRSIWLHWFQSLTLNPRDMHPFHTVVNRARTSLLAVLGCWLLLGAGKACANRLRDDPQRPQFHPMPRKNWCNDPNGPVYWKGMYHLFFQYNPNAPVWGDMHVRWKCSWDCLSYVLIAFCLVHNTAVGSRRFK